MITNTAFMCYVFMFARMLNPIKMLDHVDQGTVTISLALTGGVAAAAWELTLMIRPFLTSIQFVKFEWLTCVPVESVGRKGSSLK